MTEDNSRLLTDRKRYKEGEMKAKDTIIDDTDLTDTAAALYNFRDAMDIKGIKSILWQQANQQAKISFKAGKQEFDKKWEGMSCEKHPNTGTIILSDGDERCYGCYLEQFERCPLCGYEWEDPRECRKGEDVSEGYKQ